MSHTSIMPAQAWLSASTPVRSFSQQVTPSSSSKRASCHETLRKQGLKVASGREGDAGLGFLLSSSSSYSHGSQQLSLKLAGGGAHGQCLATKRVGSLSVVARVGGGRSYAPRPRPRLSRDNNKEERDKDAPLMNEEIRNPSVRLLAADQKMIGIVPREEALALAREASLDLVMISSDADPPVVRIMDYSKFRYEQQKKKREAQKKAAANRVEVKELKMRYNIDVGDYNVRLKQAQKFLADGDKVKVTIQFRGREMEFKKLGVKLFDRFQEDLAELAVLESRAQMEGRNMVMILTQNKAAMQKAQATSQKEKTKQKRVEESSDAEDEDEDPVADVGGSASNESISIPPSKGVEAPEEVEPLVHENLLG